MFQRMIHYIVLDKCILYFRTTYQIFWFSLLTHHGLLMGLTSIVCHLHCLAWGYFKIQTISDIGELKQPVNVTGNAILVDMKLAYDTEEIL